MKKKQTNRSKDPGNKDSTTSCSEDEKMKFTNRRSSRKKKGMSSTRDSGFEASIMIDSAYEADDSARSENSSPKMQACDEYHFDTMDDFPVVAKARKRKNGSQVKIKKGKKLKSNLNVSTSTPVNDGAKSRDGENYLITPEVTPILAVGSDSHPSQCIDNDTPTLRRSVRKRSFSFHDPDLTAISTHLSFDSHGDSGLVASPVSKKMKSSRSESAADVHIKMAASLVPAECPKPQNLFTSHKHKASSYSKTRAVLRESSMNSSCFGFDSIQTPSPAVKAKKARKIPKKPAKDLNKDYRSPKNSSDSVFDDSPGKGHSLTTSEDADSQEALASHGSPSLFTDIFSCDPVNLNVNKSTVKSYKGVKPKLKKSKPQVTKFDSWASSFNTELENIAKFELNIE